jgi:short-subunit dehydrogenase
VVSRSGRLPWQAALVTGASSGIGAALARGLARRHVGHLVLVARRTDRLDALATELDAAHGTTCEVLPADLADPASLARVEERLAVPGDRPAIDLLVNNAGLGTSGPFVTLPIEGEDREIKVNVLALVRLSRAALAPMVDRGHGAVMNVASMATYRPSPGLATYGASKAFVTMFSEALHEELRGSGVSVTAVLPGYTKTEFQAQVGDSQYNDAPSFAWMSADSVAADAIEATRRGRALCVPGVGYKLIAGGLTPLPRSARRWLMGKASGKATALARRTAPTSDAPTPEP